MPSRSEPSTGRRGSPLTRAGIQVLIVGLVTSALGRILGLGEIIGLGIALLFLDGCALVWVHIRSLGVGVTRTVTPTAAFAGEMLTVRLRVVSSSRGRSPTLRIRDRISQPDAEPSLTSIDVLPMAAGETAETPYQLMTERRGALTFGPLSVEDTDPCGLARHRREVRQAVRVLVLPGIDRISEPYGSSDVDEPEGSAPAAPRGSEFVSLRDYVPGDDLRKVHWRTSARRDTLVVRHDEHPIQRRCTVVLDVRSAVHDPDTLERAVSAAASILVAAARGSQQIRLLVTDGFASPTGSGRAHLHALLEKLALVATDETAPSLGAPGSEPTICVTTSVGARSLAPAYPRGRFVTFDPDGGRPESLVEDGDGTSLRVGPHDRFADVWDAAMITGAARTLMAARR